MSNREWPASISASEGVQLAGLLAVFAAVSIYAFTPSSQLLTPVSAALWGMSAAAGAGLGFWLGRILTRVNRDWNDRFTNMIAWGLVIFLGAFIFYIAAWSFADRYAFSRGGVASIAKYPVQKVTKDRRHNAYWAIINPFGLSRGAMVPLSKRDHELLAPLCAGRCVMPICIKVPIESAPGGATRVMSGESDFAPSHRPIAQCNGEPIPVVVATSSRD
ncbi:MAG: hypothetical protein V4808_04810 [Pseudomonadota bacterium]